MSQEKGERVRSALLAATERYLRPAEIAVVEEPVSCPPGDLIAAAVGVLIEKRCSGEDLQQLEVPFAGWIAGPVEQLENAADLLPIITGTASMHSVR
jgi:hypothetical protein